MTRFFAALALLPSEKEPAPTLEMREEHPHTPLLAVLEGVKLFVDLAEKRGARFGDGGPPDHHQLEAVLWTLALGRVQAKPDSLLTVKVRERASKGGELPLSTLWDLLDHHEARLHQPSRSEVQEEAAEIRRGIKTRFASIREAVDRLTPQGQYREKVLLDEISGAAYVERASLVTGENLAGKVAGRLRKEALERPGNPSTVSSQLADEAADERALADFADRERLAKTVRDAGLSSQELESWYFAIRFGNKAAAELLGRSANQVAQEKSRAKDKLRATR